MVGQLRRMQQQRLRRHGDVRELLLRSHAQDASLSRRTAMLGLAKLADIADATDVGKGRKTTTETKRETDRRLASALAMRAVAVAGGSGSGSDRAPSVPQAVAAAVAQHCFIEALTLLANSGSAAAGAAEAEAEAELEAEVEGLRDDVWRAVVAYERERWDSLRGVLGPALEAGLRGTGLYTLASDPATCVSAALHPSAGAFVADGDAELAAMVGKAVDLLRCP